MAAPHHDGSALYVAQAAPQVGMEVQVWVRVPSGTPVTGVHVRTVPDGQETFSSLSVDTERTGRAVGGYGVGDTWWTGAVHVRNIVTAYRFLLATASGPTWLTAAGLAVHDVPDSTDFRLVAHSPSAPWTAQAVVYEILPDRFAKSAYQHAYDAPLPPWAVPSQWDTAAVVHEGPMTPRQVFGGDLDGIADNLDYLCDLGVDTIYLRPVFPAPSNHRYNATTFDEVDDLLGGRPALERLAKAVHGRGMRLVGDITTNHCGDTHAWFVTAMTDPASPERGMFYFEQDGEYEAWLGVRTLPKLNWGSDLTWDRMSRVVRQWLTEFDGWRVDVANMTGRYKDQDFSREIASALNRVVRTERADGVLVAEHMFDASADLDTGGWDGIMNYAGFTRPVWTWLRGPGGEDIDFIGRPGGIPHGDGSTVLATMRTFAATMSWRSATRSWLVLDSFDCARIRSVVVDRERHVVAAGLQATLPGVPMICAGTEFGLTATNGEQGRIPMPWRRGQDRDEDMHRTYQQLFGLRSREPALRDGGLRWLHADADTLVYARETATHSVFVAARRAAGEPVDLPCNQSLQGLFDADDLVPVGGVVRLPGDGPSLRMWRVGGGYPG